MTIITATASFGFFMLDAAFTTWRHHGRVLADRSIPSQASIRPLLAYGVPMSIPDALFRTNLQLDILILTWWVSSADVGLGLNLVAPGIVAFALNKVLFAAINGRGALRLYAWMQMARAVFVLIALAVIVALGAPVWAVGGIFATAELALLPCLLAAVRPEPTRALYFVARGDGSSVFSDNLADHNRAVNQYQRAQR